MNAFRLIELMNRHPFKPFEIHLDDGARIPVEHPWLVSTSANSPTCVVHEAENDRMRIISYRNISEIVTAAI